ncbi:MAG: ATP-binding protein [Geminicoccaceae bacterium]
MLRTKLLNTTTFRLTLLYLGVFSLSALALLAFVYFSSVRFMEGQTREGIEADRDWFTDQIFPDKVDRLPDLVRSRAENEPNRRNIFLLTDIFGQYIAGNLDQLPVEKPDEHGYVRFDVKVKEDGRLAVKSHPAIGLMMRLQNGATLLIGRDIADKVHTQGVIRTAILLGSGLMILLGLFGGWLTSRWTLHRLEVVNRTAGRIMAGDLSQRVQVKGGGGDEFDDLAMNVNGMLERIERLLASMRQVTDDIAHDLRTPLNRIRSRIEVALMGEPSSEESRELLEATMRDADRLIETFNALLNIARAEAGGQRGDWEPIDLSEVAHDVAELYEPLAEEKGVSLTLHTPELVEVLGSRQLIAQAIANVVDNAVKYTPENGAVVVRTTRRPAPQIVVTDSGPGIPVDDRERAKERFVRLDSTRTTPGSGLGLSLVDAVAKLHEAKLEMGDNNPGLVVTLTFKPPGPVTSVTRTETKELLPAAA